MYTVYIIKSVKFGRYYVDCSKDVHKRLHEHNSKLTKSTKAYVPWKIVYTEEFENKSQAFQREKKIKSYKSGIKFKQLIHPEGWTRIAG